MKAVIIPANDSENLKPLTQTKPRGMLDIFDKPILEYLIEHLKNNGIKEYVFLSKEANEVIKNHFENGEKMGVSIEYSSDIPEDDILYIESPAITDIDIKNAMKIHKNKKSGASVLLHQRLNAKGCQIVVTDDNNMVTDFDNLKDEITSPDINSGMYLLTKEFLAENPFFPNGFDPKRQAVLAINCEGYFFLIKSFDDYLTCAYDLLDGNETAKNGVSIGENTFIEVGAKIKPPVYIGENTHIEKNAEIMPYSVIGKNSRIEEGAKIENSIVLHNVRIMKNCELAGCIIGESSVIGQGARLFSGSVVGEYTKIGKEAVISPNVSVYNEKYIANNLVVTENVIDGAYEPDVTFSDGKITGDPTFDLTMEKAFKIGAVFGVLNPNCPIGLFKDDTGSSEMIANSISAGLKSVGSIIYEFSNSLHNMCKTACSFYSLIGGIFVYNTVGKGVIEFFSRDGANISPHLEEKIEELLAHDEIPMVDPAKIPKTIQMANYKNYYYADIVKRLDTNRLSVNVVLEKTSQSVVDYVRKMAVLYNLTLIPARKSGVNSFIRAEISTAGKSLTLWDENDQRLSERQLEAIMAVILLESDSIYISRAHESEVIKMFVMDMKIEAAGEHVSEQERAMLKIGSKEQFFMKNDAVYLLFKILFYLKSTGNNLSELVLSLPKTYFIESSYTSPVGFSSTVSKITNVENDLAYHKIKNKNK